MKSTIPENLTFEQFKTLADREPSLEGNWVYCLTHDILLEEYRYPEFRIHHTRYMFLTLVDAEKYMREKLIPRKDRYDTYRLLIEQIPIGEIENEVGAAWLYDKDGKLIEIASTISEGIFPDSCFFGRSEEYIRFQEGDIVEVVDEDTVHLAIVGTEGPTVEEFWKIYSDSEDKSYYADRIDDCYYVISGPGCHAHPHVTSVMKPRLPIPQDIREFFEECLVMSKKREYPFDPLRLSMETPIMFEAASIDIILLYDRDQKRHRLSLRTTDNINDAESERKLPQGFSDKELWNISEWLNYKKYGKSRLWYLISEWNKFFGSDERPALSPNTPLEELLKV